MNKKHLIAPTLFKVESDYLVIGEKYTRILTVVKFPDYFDTGFFNVFLGNPDIKVYSNMTPLEADLNTELRKDYNQKLKDYNSSKDITEREYIKGKLQSLYSYIQLNTKRKDKQWNFTIFLMLQKPTLKELNEFTQEITAILRGQEILVNKLANYQKEMFRYATNVFGKSGLPKEVEYNLGIPLPSTSVAGLYPYTFDTIKDPNGFLLGYEKYNGGVVIFDIFSYLTNEQQARINDRLNANTLIIGKSGAGKTTTLYLFIRYFIKEMYRTIWIDPESKNRPICEKYGKYIEWGTNNSLINIFDLKMTTSDDEDETEEETFNTRLAVLSNIEDLKNVMVYIHPNIEQGVLSSFGEYVMEIYKEKGFDAGRYAKNKTFKDKYYIYDEITNQYIPNPEFVKMMPTFSDLMNCIERHIHELEERGITSNYEYDLLLKMRTVLRPFVFEYSVYFDGYTTVNVSDDTLIGFGTKKLESKSDNLINALNHIMLQFAWSLCSDRSQFSVLLIDEFHKYTTPVGKKIIGTFQRRSRKYHNATVLATQETNDFANAASADADGKAIVNNAAYTLIMMLEENGIEDVAKLVHLTDNEITELRQLHMGQALFFLGNIHNVINVLVTPEELAELPN